MSVCPTLDATSKRKGAKMCDTTKEFRTGPD
jgi:hypothetical protein